MLTSAYRNRPFERSENALDAVSVIARPDKKMHVLRHDHVSPKIEIPFHTSRGDGIDNPLTRCVLREQRPAFVAGVGQKMSVARLVIRALGFAEGGVHDVLVAS